VIYSSSFLGGAKSSVELKLIEPRPALILLFRTHATNTATATTATTTATATGIATATAITQV
jgi:hypothetical protein